MDETQKLTDALNEVQTSLTKLYRWKCWRAMTEFSLASITEMTHEQLSAAMDADFSMLDGAE